VVQKLHSAEHHIKVCVTSHLQAGSWATTFAAKLSASTTRYCQKHGIDCSCGPIASALLHLFCGCWPVLLQLH